MSRQIAQETVFYAAVFHLILIEALFAIFGFIGFLDVFVIGSISMLVLQSVAFLISLVMWIIIFRVFGKYMMPATVGGYGVDVNERGAAIFRSTCVYFGVTSIIHALFLTAWIIWLCKYGDLHTLNFVTNFGPFIIKLILLACQFLIFFIALFYFISDIRHQSLTQLFRSLVRSKPLAPESADSQLGKTGR